MDLNKGQKKELMKKYDVGEIGKPKNPKLIDGPGKDREFREKQQKNKLD